MIVKVHHERSSTNREMKANKQTNISVNKGTILYAHKSSMIEVDSMHMLVQLF